MKRVTAFFFVCLLLLAGCQPTPAVETVPPKDFDALIEKAQTSPATVQVTLVPEAEDISAAAAEEALERFQMEFYGNSEAFHVVVDAQVVRPQGPFPILEVTPGDFDDESAQPFFDVLTEGYTLYTAEELETKASLEKQITEMQQFIDDGLPGYDGPASKKKDEIKHWKSELEKLKQRYLTARDEPGTPAAKVQLTWREPAKYDTQTAGAFLVQSADRKQTFQVRTNATGAHGKRNFDSKEAVVMFYNDAALPENAIHAFYQSDAIEDRDAVPAGSGLSVTPREAQEQAEALVQRLGLTDFAVKDVRLTHAPEEAEGLIGVPCYLYSVSFARMVNGVPVIRPTNRSSSGDEAEPRPSWSYEKLAVSLRNKDVYGFTYGGPLVLGKTLVEDAQLMPFDAVMERFDQMVRVKYEGMMKDPGYGNIQSMEVQVDRIELSLERVAQPDNINGGLLVPVWSFYGSILCTRPEDSFDRVFDHTMPFLTLNAVDGTLIDPMKGY